MSKKWLSIFCCLLLTITATACNAQTASSEENGASESSISVSSGSESASAEENSMSENSLSASSGSESAAPEETEPEKGNFTVIGIDGEKYSIDLKDMHTITHEFIGPLIVNSSIWGYNWETPEEIHADDLINFCAHANFWNFPQDFEGCYLPDQNTQKADLVEDKILEHFDVERRYLKTSSLYLAEEDAYRLLGGWGGGWEAIALSADLQGDLLKIEVGYFTDFTLKDVEEYRLNPENPLPDGYYSPDRIIGENNRIIIPGGTLTVRLQNGVIQYQSWERRPDIDF